MSKAHLLVICLLAASFTGCLGSDDIEPSIVKEEDTIEPVGTGDNGGNETNNYNETNHYYYNNDTYYVNGTDYLELISQVENLTAEVEALRLEIEEMQSSKYEVPENSTYITYKYICNIEINDGECDYYPYYEIIKIGNIVVVNYIGPYGPGSGNQWSYDKDNSPANCTDYFEVVRFMNVDGVIISEFGSSRPKTYFGAADIEMSCSSVVTDTSAGGPDIDDIWSTITFVLPEEPVRIAFGAGTNSVQTFTFS